MFANTPFAKTVNHINCCFAPTAAKFFAYTECVITAASTKDSQWCDCKLTSTKDLPASNHNAAQKETVKKNDWKYTIKASFYYTSLNPLTLNQWRNTNTFFVSSLFDDDMLRPPACC